LKGLAQEIKEARDAHDRETAAKLQKEFIVLTNHLKVENSSRKRGHKKKCGPISPGERADQAIRVGLTKLEKRFRQKGLPTLADHLEKYINNSDGEWAYLPPPSTSTWQVTVPISPK
jgi:hypothetical protein